MPRTRSQEHLEQEPGEVSNEPVYISGVPPWIAALLTTLLLIIFAVLLSAVSGGDINLGPSPEFTLGANAPAQAPPPAAPPAPAEPTGTVLAGDVPILPVPPEGLAPYTGRTIRANAVAVQSVVADEGFWVGPDAASRLYVVYRTGGFESPPDIDLGQLVSFVGALEPASGDLAPQFRMTEAEGLGQLLSQGYFVNTADVDVLTDPPPEEPD
jgi:hypothetical protein